MDDLDSKALEALEREVHAPDPLPADHAAQVELMVARLASLERGLYADRLPPRDHTADAAELVRLAALFASLPANETAKHRDQLAQASGDLDAVMKEMMG